MFGYSIRKVAKLSFSSTGPIKKDWAHKERTDYLQKLKSMKL